MTNVIVVIGAGQIGQAIARRVGVGKHIVLADTRQDNANAAAEVLGNAGYDVSVATVDVSSRETVMHSLERPRVLATLRDLSMQPVSRPRRHRQRRSAESISTARRSSWTRSALSSLPAGLV